MAAILASGEGLQFGAERAACAGLIARQLLKIRRRTKEAFPEGTTQRRLQHAVDLLALAASEAGEGAQAPRQQ